MTKQEILRILQEYKLNEAIFLRGEHYKKIRSDDIKNYLESNMEYIIQLRFLKEFCIRRLYNNGILGQILIWCSFK